MAPDPMNKPDGGTAFPSHEHFIANGGATGDRKVITGQPHGGMSLRDYFAGQAMTLFADPTLRQIVAVAATKAESDLTEAIGVMAYQLADAMLAERSKEGAHGA